MFTNNFLFYSESYKNRLRYVQDKFVAQIRPFEINEKISTVKEKKDEDVFCIKDLIMKARKKPAEFPTVKLRLVHNTTFDVGDRISIKPNYFGIEMSDNYNRNIWYDEDEKCFVTCN